MVRSIRSPYEGELVDNDRKHGGPETYRIDSHDEHHDRHTILSHESNNLNTLGHGHKHGKSFGPYQHRLGENAVPALVQAFSGAIGATIAHLAVHPLDVIIKRLQVQRQIQMRHRAERKSRSDGRASGSQNISTSSKHHVSHTASRPSRSRSRSGSRGDSPDHVVLGMGSAENDGGRVRGEHSHSYSESHSHSHSFSTTAVDGKYVEERVEWTETSEELELEGQYTGVIDAAQKIWAQEGLGGFYIGALEETVGTLGGAFWYFAVYSYLRNKRLHKRHAQGLPVLEELLIGLAAGSVSKFFLTPFNTIATRKQTHIMLYPNSKAASIVDIYHDIMREKGITGFWSGYSAGAFLSLNPSITFLLYESLKGFAGGKRRRLKGAETFLLAAVAKAIATGMTYPLAVARSRAQISNEDDDFNFGDMISIGKVGQGVKKVISRKARRSGNVIEVLADIFKREGIAGLYEGVLGEILRGFVSSGITMVIKESVHRTILSLYYFVMRAYNRSGDHTFQSTTKIIAKDAYNKAGPRQKKLINKAIEGVGKVTSSASQGKAKVAGLVGASHAAHKFSEVREKISETTGMGKHGREGSNHKVVKVAAATAAVAGLAAGAIHARKRNSGHDEHENGIAHAAHERNERYDEHGNDIVRATHERNERYDEHGNVIVHTARERVEEWREGVDDERIHAAKVSHSHSRSGHVVDDRIHGGQVSHSHSHSGHVVDDRIHTGEMRQEVVETRTHSGSGNVGSHIGRHNGVTEHTRIEERVQHNHSGSGSHSRRGSAVASGIVGTVTGGALGHKLSSHSQNEHSRNSSHGTHGGLIGTAAGAALGHKLSSHSHNEHSHSSSHGTHGGLVGTATGAALGHKLSSHSHNEHSHSNSHGSHGGLIGTAAGATLGHKVSSHSHTEHSHNNHSGHGGLASGVVGAVAGAALGHKISSHSHNEHSHNNSNSHSNSHGGITSKIVGAVSGAVLGNKLSSHSHNEQIHSSHGGHVGSHSHNEHSHSSSGQAGLASGVVGAVTGAVLGNKLSGHSHSSGGHVTSLASGAVGAVTGAVLGNKLSGHGHNEHSHSSSYGGHGSLVGTAAGATLGHKLSSHSHNEHSHSSGGHSGLVSGVVGAVTGAALGHKTSSHSHNEHSHSNSNSHSNSHGGIASKVVGAVSGAVLGNKLSSHSHNEHSHSSSHSGHGGLVGTAAGATLGQKLSSHSHSHNEHGHSHSGHAHSHHGGDVITTQTTKIVEEFGIMKDPRTPLMHDHHESHQAVADSRARFGETSHHERTSVHESRGREHGAVASAVTGAVERIVGSGHSSHGRSHSGSRHNSSADLMHRATGSHNHGHGQSTHGRDGQTIMHTETVREWRDEANAVEDLRQFGVASTVNEDSRSDFGEMLHKGHSIVGHGHNNRFGDDAVVHDGRGHTIIEKTQITRIGENLHDGGHHSHSHDSHGSHGHRHSESRSNFGDSALRTDGRTIVEKTQITRIGETLQDAGRHSHRHNDSALHTDGRTIVEKTEVTRIGGTSHNAHSHNAIPTRSPLGRLEDAAINKVVERTQITSFGETHKDSGHQHHQQQHSSHSSHSHGNNGVAIGNAGHDSAVTRTTVRETGWLGKQALVNNASPLNASSINTAAATAGSNAVTTVTRTEEFWPVDEDARSSVYNFLDEDTKEVGGVKIETRATGGGWWSDKRGKGYN